LLHLSCRHEFFEQRIVLVVLDHLFLAGEIPKERHVRHPGRRSDLLDCRCVITFLDEEPQSVLLDRMLGRRFLAGAPVVAFGHGVRTPTGSPSALSSHARSRAASAPRHARCPSGRTNRASRSPRNATTSPRRSRATSASGSGPSSAHSGPNTSYSRTDAPL